MTDQLATRMAVLRAEFAAYREALNTEDIVFAWQHLERAHIVAQPLLAQYLRSHRLMLVAPGNVTRRLPPGNNGCAPINAFDEMSAPNDLERFVR